MQTILKTEKLQLISVCKMKHIKKNIICWWVGVTILLYFPVNQAAGWLHNLQCLHGDILCHNVAVQHCLPCLSGVMSNRHACLWKSSGLLVHRVSLCRSMVCLMPLLSQRDTRRVRNTHNLSINHIPMWCLPLYVTTWQHKEWPLVSPCSQKSNPSTGSLDGKVIKLRAFVLTWPPEVSL